MKFLLSIMLIFTLFNCSSSDDDYGFKVISDSSYYYHDTVYVANGQDIIYFSPYQYERDIEMPYSLALLYAFSYYQSDIPDDYTKFESPEYMYNTIPDTLKNVHYTYYVSKRYVTSYLNNFTMDERRFFGVTISSYMDTIFVSNVFKGSAADSAGIKRGDKIIAVDKYELYGDIDVYNAVVNDNYKEYSFAVHRNEQLDTIVMSKIKMTVPASYSDSLTEDVGYVNLTSFIADSSTEGGSTSHQFYNALLETKNYPVTIIDIRGNGGGYISEAYYCANMFLAKGAKIVKEVNWVADFNSPTLDGEYIEETKLTTSEGEFINRKFVFLVDDGSASASEILLSAIEFNTDHPIVGVQTYGKGIGQSSINALNGAMAHITKLELFKPDGTKYHNIGFTPDYIIPAGVEDFKDIQLTKAIEVANGLLNESSLKKTLSTTVLKYSDFNSTKNYLGFPELGFEDMDLGLNGFDALK